jgi:uncharacterized protein
LSEFFVDTSALVKHYVNETGSVWVQSWMSRSAGNVIVLSQLASVEFVAVLARRLREGKMTPVEFTTLRGAFLTDKDEFYLSIDLDDAVFIHARDLVADHVLRTLDAIQLACALEAAHLFNIQPTFISADTRLLAAAAAEGLPTDDPNAHP